MLNLLPTAEISEPGGITLNPAQLAAYVVRTGATADFTDTTPDALSMTNLVGSGDYAAFMYSNKTVHSATIIPGEGVTIKAGATVVGHATIPPGYAVSGVVINANPTSVIVAMMLIGQAA